MRVGGAGMAITGSPAEDSAAIESGRSSPPRDSEFDGARAGSAERHWQVLPDRESRGTPAPAVARRLDSEAGVEVRLMGLEVSQQHPEVGRVTQQQPLRHMASARSREAGPAVASCVADTIPTNAARAIQGNRNRRRKTMRDTLRERVFRRLSKLSGPAR